MKNPIFLNVVDVDRLKRGGCWNYDDIDARVSDRYDFSWTLNMMGLRLFKNRSS